MSHIGVLVLISVVMLRAPLSRAQLRPLRDDIRRTYNFQPHLLTDQERNDKSAVMDQFWNKVKAGKGSLLQALRSELADLSNPRFFLYDGSLLLLSLSDTGADRRLPNSCKQNANQFNFNRFIREGAVASHRIQIFRRIPSIRIQVHRNRREYFANEDDLHV